jgi:hypothetical protein
MNGARPLDRYWMMGFVADLVCEAKPGMLRIEL